MQGSFARAFSKARRSRRDRRSPPQRRKISFGVFLLLAFLLRLLCQKKSGKRFRPFSCRGWNSFLHNENPYRLPAFFFVTRGANENCLAPLSPGAQAPPCAWQKRTRRTRSFALASATNAPRVGSAVAFGKATQNFQQNTAVAQR